MNFLSSLSSAVISASSAALSNVSSQIPGVSGYSLGDKVPSFQGKSIWTLYHGIKRVCARLAPSRPLRVVSLAVPTSPRRFSPKLTRLGRSNPG